MSHSAERQDVYFALSHTRSTVPDRWVKRFHQLLENEVQSRAEPSPGLRVGSLYFPTEAEAAAAMASASTPDARVQIPLFTREFLHSLPPDYVRFREPGEGRWWHVHPVIWDPLPGGHHVGGLPQARSLGADIPEYRDCGLAAMCRLTVYAPLFKEIVERLADRIVDAAQKPDQEPVWATSEPTIPTETVSETRFILSVIAPEGTTWNPYGTRLPGTLAEYAAGVAKKLRLLPEIIDYVPAASTGDGVRESPGVMLIDPWALQQDETRAAVEQALKRPPPWVTVVMVVDRLGVDDERILRELLGRANEITGSVLTIVHDVREFKQEIEEVVLRTRRSYLRGHPINPDRGDERGTDKGDRHD